LVELPDIHVLDTLAIILDAAEPLLCGMEHCRCDLPLLASGPDVSGGSLVAKRCRYVLKRIGDLRRYFGHWTTLDYGSFASS
jgi:hypothetical protein